jgi:hypothetical protein
MDNFKRERCENICRKVKGLHHACRFQIQHPLMSSVHRKVKHGIPVQNRCRSWEPELSLPHTYANNACHVRVCPLIAFGVSGFTFFLCHKSQKAQYNSSSGEQEKGRRKNEVHYRRVTDATKEVLCFVLHSTLRLQKTKAK